MLNGAFEGLGGMILSGAKKKITSHSSVVQSAVSIFTVETEALLNRVETVSGFQRIERSGKFHGTKGARIIFNSFAAKCMMDKAVIKTGIVGDKRAGTQEFKK